MPSAVASSPLALVALLAALFAGAVAEAREWKRVRIATDGAYPPFSLTEANGRPTGYDVEVAGEVCRRIGAECEIAALGWDGLVPALEARRVDLLVASMPIADTGRRGWDFTSAYHRIGPRFVARRGQGPADPARASLAGLAVGVRAGTAHAAHLAAAHPKARVVAFPTEAAAGAALLDGRVDLVFGDTLALYRWLDGTAPRGAAGFVGDEVLDAATFGAGAGIAFRRDDRDLGQLVDRALVEMTRDGTLDRLAAHWFPFAIR